MCPLILYESCLVTKAILQQTRRRLSLVLSSILISESWFINTVIDGIWCKLFVQYQNSLYFFDKSEVYPLKEFGYSRTVHFQFSHMTILLYLMERGNQREVEIDYPCTFGNWELKNEANNTTWPYLLTTEH